MPVSTLTTLPFGPFDGVVDTKNSSLPLPGKLRNMQNLVFSGGTRLSVQNGTVVALTLKDDAGTPATVTRVLHVGSYMDGAIAIAHSTVTSKVYLYRLPATMDGWYNAAGALVATASPQPCAVLWTSVTAPPDVWVAEGLGTLYIAQTSAIDEAGLYYRTQTVVFSAAGVPTVADLKANGTGGAAGADNAYFTAVWSFHQHLWGVGYGAGTTPGFTSFRPELAKFSGPSFGALQTADSIVIGDKVRALRERVINGAVAGNALFLGASKYLFRIVGYGRDSWVVETLDQKYGPVGPKAGIGVGHQFYYWTTRGLCRCADGGQPEPLWDAIVGAVATVANESKIVLGFDSSTDRVLVLYDTGVGVRTLCAFDTRRDDYCSLDGDIGLVVNCAGIVEPIYQSTATPPAAPAGPTIVSTTLVTNTTARYTWSVGDALAQHELTYRIQGQPTYALAALTDAGVTVYDAAGLTAGTAYEWRLRAYKNGVYSAYVGPTAASQFTTTGGVTGPAPPTGLTAIVSIDFPGRWVQLDWINADPSLVTEVWRSTDGVTFFQQSTEAAGVTTAFNNVMAAGLFYFKVRHVEADSTPGQWSAAASIVMT